MRVVCWQLSSACILISVLVIILHTSAQAFNAKVKEVAFLSADVKSSDDEFMPSDGATQNHASAPSPLVTAHHPHGGVKHILPQSQSISIQTLERDGIQSTRIDPATQASFRKAMMLASGLPEIAKATMDTNKKRKVISQANGKIKKTYRQEQAVFQRTTRVEHVSLKSTTQLSFFVGDLLVQFDPETDEAAKQRFLMQPAPSQFESLTERRRQSQSMPSQQRQNIAINAAKILGGDVVGAAGTSSNAALFTSPLVTTDHPHRKIMNILPQSQSTSIQTLERDGIQSTRIDPATQASFRKAMMMASGLPEIAKATMDTNKKRKVIFQANGKIKKTYRQEQAVSQRTTRVEHVSLKSTNQLSFFVGDLLVQFDPETDEAAKQRFLMQPAPSQFESLTERRRQLRSVPSREDQETTLTAATRGGDNVEAIESKKIVGDILIDKYFNTIGEQEIVNSWRD